jgi:hypothetical protein
MHLLEQFLVAVNRYCHLIPGVAIDFSTELDSEVFNYAVVALKAPGDFNPTRVNWKALGRAMDRDGLVIGCNDCEWIGGRISELADNANSLADMEAKGFAVDPGGSCHNDQDKGS